MKKITILLLFLFCTVTLGNAQIQFEEIFSGFESVDAGATAFSDVDGDNDIDVIITGRNSSNLPIANLYINDGNGNYSLASGTPFEGVYGGSIAFADIDGDMDPDLLITGLLNNSGQRISGLYVNGGNGIYSIVSGTPFDAVSSSSIAFADIDGDNDQDVLITGYNNSGQRIAKLYANDGNGIYSIVSGTPFEGVLSASVAFADVDGDSDQDVMITGQNSANQPVTKLYENDGNGGYSLITGTTFDDLVGSIAFSDVDGDNDMDVLITGYNNNSNQRLAKLYINNGNGGYSVKTNTPFEGVYGSSIAFADVDRDNDQDVLITGWNNNGEEIAKLYSNNGNAGFSLVSGTPFEGVVDGHIAFADIDGDEDQDILITGRGDSYSKITNLYKNITPIEDTTSFITTWKTDNPGSSCNSCITIPTTGTGYNYDVDWNDDGVFDDIGITGNITHDFGTPGTYTVRIRGDFPQIYFNLNLFIGGDMEKILSVDQWGEILWQSMEKAFWGCKNLIIKAIDVPNLTNVTNMQLAFGEAELINHNFENWDVSHVTNMSKMFMEALTFDQNISNWNVSQVKNMNGMFLGASAFNQDIGNWDVSNVTDMSFLFLNASSFNQNIENWNVSQVTNMSNMFSYATDFNQDIGNWDVSQVTNMSSMFSYASAFNQDIGNWDISSVIDMNNMFVHAYSFNRNIGNWNVSQVTNMSSMFSYASTFNQDIGNWDVSSVIDMTNMFGYNSLSTQNYDNILIGWSGQNLQPNLNFHGGNSQYCEGAAARQQMINHDGWTITDAGPAGDLLTFDQEPLPDITQSSAVISLPAPTATNCVGETVTATTTTSFPITHRERPL